VHQYLLPESDLFLEASFRGSWIAEVWRFMMPMVLYGFSLRRGEAGLGAVEGGTGTLVGGV